MPALCYNIIMKKKYIAIIILAVVAIVNATYLSKQAYYYQVLDSYNHKSVCDISSTMSCSLVLQSPYSKVFGVPFPYIALVVYPIILIIALYGAQRQSLKPAKLLAGISLLGMLFNFFIMYREIFFAHAFCPLCFVCTLIIISIFIISLHILKKNKISQ